MATQKRESLRVEAARRGITVARVRKERALAEGYSASQGYGKAKPTEQSFTDIHEGIPTPVRRSNTDPSQRYRYRYWIEGYYTVSGWRFLGVIDSPRRLSIKTIEKEVWQWFQTYSETELVDHYGEEELPERIRVARVTTA